MKNTILLLVLFICSTFSLSAQKVYSIHGKVIDTSLNNSLAEASICVLNSKDSILQAFTWTKMDGEFAMSNLRTGSFILLVTYPGYADYIEKFSLDSNKSNYEFGPLNMKLKAKLLTEVIIKGKKSRIKINGDTTEYIADAFVVQPNAKVEDLLRQFPGIQIDKDGKIIAQGQAVNKVLVDGEEFFGDDPTLVTKNIRADMVDKIQLYDKKSDQATFTGIDDGKKIKTINVVLKEDKKSGYFGKIDIGDGSGGYYEGQGLFNMFKAKQKFSTYATVSNDGVTGLGWQDSQNIGSSSDNVQVGDNGDGLGSFNGQFTGQGKPTAHNGGVHYDGKWDNDKESINANYKTGSLEVDGASNTITQNNLPNNYVNGNSNQIFNNFMFRQKLDLTYKIKLNSTSDLKIDFGELLKNTHIINDYIASSTDNVGNIINKNSRDIDNKDNSNTIDAVALYTKKFKTKGRTYSFLVDFFKSNTNSDGYLNSTTKFYNFTKTSDSTQIIDQFKTSSQKTNALSINQTYTEPFSKFLSVLFNYTFKLYNDVSEKKSFNSSTPEIYNLLVDSLSNSYKLSELLNQFGVVFNYKNNKTNFSFGGKFSSLDFKQVDQLNQNTLKRDFFNWNPQANFQYHFSMQKFVIISYQEYNEQPTISQIQPLATNVDPLNIIVGNPNLKQSFTHRFSFQYLSFKVLNGQSVFINGNYVLVNNPIVFSQITDSTGKSIDQYVNLADKKQSNYNISTGFGRTLVGPQMDISFSITINGSNSYNLSNGEINLTKSYSYSTDLTLSKTKAKNYDLTLKLSPNYTISGSSIQPMVNNNAPGFDAKVYFELFIKGKFQIISNSTYEFRGKTPTFDTDFNSTLINISLNRTFLRNDNLKASLSGNDLLNQNIGFNRTTVGNVITQNSYSVIKRHFLISLVYDFNKMGNTKNK